MSFFWYNARRKQISAKNRETGGDMSVLTVLTREADEPYHLTDAQADKFGKYVAALLNKYYHLSAEK
jgi:hypothetical protein